MPPAFEATLILESNLAQPLAAALRPRLPQWVARVLRPAHRAHAQGQDRSTGLYNRQGLFAAAHAALLEHGHRTPAGMILFEFPDLREVCEIYGNAVARKVVAKVVRRLRTVAGRSGLVGRTGPTQFTVVFPGGGEDKALKALQRGLGNPARIEFDAGDSEIVLVPDIVVDAADAGMTGVQETYREMCRELERMRSIEMRRLNFLTSERERHSRPMGFPGRVS